MVELLEGLRQPKDENEAYYLRFMGGIRGPKEGWPVQWLICPDCKAEYQKRAFPSPTPSGWVFNALCPECAKKPAEKPYRWKPKRAKERKDLD